MNAMWTILIGNELNGASGFRGAYSTEESAIQAAKTESLLCRSFATFEVWTGTPKDPKKPTKNLFRGIR